MIRFHVPNMHCGGCVRAVTAALQGAAAGAEIHTDLDRREVTVKGTTDAATLSEALRAAGFEGHRLSA